MDQRIEDGTLEGHARGLAIMHLHSQNGDLSDEAQSLFQRLKDQIQNGQSPYAIDDISLLPTADDPKLEYIRTLFEGVDPRIVEVLNRIFATHYYDTSKFSFLFNQEIT